MMHSAAFKSVRKTVDYTVPTRITRVTFVFSQKYNNLNKDFFPLHVNEALTP